MNNDRDQLRQALAQTLYESMNDYLRLWGDLEDERRKTWLIHADALLPVVREFAARELRAAATVVTRIEALCDEYDRQPWVDIKLGDVLDALGGDQNGCPDQPHHGVDCPGDACRYAARDESARELEQRVRALIERIELVNTNQPDGTTETHWFNRGMDEAYDNVIDWLYRDVLGEER